MFFSGSNVLTCPYAATSVESMPTIDPAITTLQSTLDRLFEERAALDAKIEAIRLALSTLGAPVDWARTSGPANPPPRPSAAASKSPPAPKSPFKGKKHTPAVKKRLAKLAKIRWEKAHNAGHKTLAEAARAKAK